MIIFFMFILCVAFSHCSFVLFSHIAIAAIGSSHDCWLVALCHVVSVDVGFTFNNTNNVNGAIFSLSHY